MEKLEKALELRELRKAKYIKRTGGRGHYKYQYGTKGRNQIQTTSSEKPKADRKGDKEKLSAIEQYKSEFKADIVGFMRRDLLPNEEKKIKATAEKHGNRLKKLVASIGRFIAFEGKGIMSGLETFYKLKKVDIPSMTIEISRGKKTFTKRMDDLVYGKEKFEIRKA